MNITLSSSVTLRVHIPSTVYKKKWTLEALEVLKLFQKIALCMFTERFFLSCSEPTSSGGESLMQSQTFWRNKHLVSYQIR